MGYYFSKISTKQIAVVIVALAISSVGCEIPSNTNPGDDPGGGSDDGNTPWSGINPEYISPENNGGTVNSTPLLDWEDVDEAVAYRIQVASSEDDLESAAVHELAISEYQMTTELVLGEICYWRINARNDNEEWSGWSDIWSFAMTPGIGDSYAGGYVFHLDGTNGGLVAASTDQQPALPGVLWGWYPAGIDFTLEDVGAGSANTAAIVEAIGPDPFGDGQTYAAKLCADLVMNGFDDWFLPSKNELNLMYENLHEQGIGDFADDMGYSNAQTNYWSSTAGGSKFAWHQDFDGGGQWFYLLINVERNRVRAARAFDYQ